MHKHTHTRMILEASCTTNKQRLAIVTHAHTQAPTLALTPKANAFCYVNRSAGKEKGHVTTIST